MLAYIAAILLARLKEGPLGLLRKLLYLLTFTRAKRQEI
jgi:hypothetical protein